VASSALDVPFDRLADLPRSVWLPTLITGAGHATARLAGTRAWLQALLQGQLPPAHADFGDAPAVVPMRAIVGELALPRLCRDTPTLAEQVLRTLLWHLDRINDLQPRLSREAAIAEAAREFREAWQLETQGLEEDLRLLQGLGELGALQWDSLRGRLRSRPWQEARRAARLPGRTAGTGRTDPPPGPRRARRRSATSYRSHAPTGPASTPPRCAQCKRCCPTHRVRSPASASHSASNTCWPARR
jgi:hypothetical protein